MQDFIKRFFGLCFIWVPIILTIVMVASAILMAWPGDDYAPQQSGVIASLLLWIFLIIAGYVMGTEILNQVGK